MVRFNKGAREGGFLGEKRVGGEGMNPPLLMLLQLEVRWEGETIDAKTGLVGETSEEEGEEEESREFPPPSTRSLAP